MPYKNKEDRTAAVRRHRDRKRDGQLAATKAAKIEASLGDLLRLIGFEEMSFEDLIECLRNTEKDNQGVWHDLKRGKVIYPPGQVFFGLNTFIAGNHFDEQVNAVANLLQSILSYDEDCNPES